MSFRVFIVGIVSAKKWSLGDINLRREKANSIIYVIRFLRKVVNCSEYIS